MKLPNLIVNSKCGRGKTGTVKRFQSTERVKNYGHDDELVQDFLKKMVSV